MWNVALNLSSLRRSKSFINNAGFKNQSVAKLAALDVKGNENPLGGNESLNKIACLDNRPLNNKAKVHTLPKDE